MPAIALFAIILAPFLGVGASLAIDHTKQTKTQETAPATNLERNYTPPEE